MLTKQVFFIIFVSFVRKTAQIQPTDLVDEVTEQLEQLKAIVDGEIISGKNSIYFLHSEFKQNSANTITSAIIDFEQEHDVVLAQLQTLKDLAYSAGKDPSSCTTEYEETLEILPSRYSQQIVRCISDVNSEAAGVLNSAKYIIDVTYSTVRHLEYQVAQCKEDLLCISPILTGIELNKIKLPQNIQSTVNVFDSTLKTLKLSTKYCPDKNLAEYLDLVHTILGNIEKCIEGLLS